MCGKQPHLFIPSKTGPLVLEFAVDDLALDRNAALVLEFAVKDLPSAEHSDDDDYIYAYIGCCKTP